MTAIVNANLFRIVSDFISTEATRYYLNGVLIQKHQLKGVNLVATDGHRMMVIHDEDGETTLEDVIVRLDKATMNACKPTKGDASPRLLKIEGEGFASVIFDPKENYSVAQCKDCIIDGTFPDWRRVIPRDDIEHAPATFNGKYIVDFCKAAEGMAVTKVGPVRIISKGDGPALIRFSKAPNAFGVLMPMRGGEHDENTLPWFVNAAPGEVQKAA